MERWSRKAIQVSWLSARHILIVNPCRITELHRQRFKVTGRMGEADRKVPRQPNVFVGADGKISRYNLRKFGELPYHLICSGRINDLCEHVLFNYEWLHAKLSAVPIDSVLKDFELAIQVIANHNYVGDGGLDSTELLRQVNFKYLYQIRVH